MTNFTKNTVRNKAIRFKSLADPLTLMSLSNSSAIRKSLPKATCGSIPKYKFHFNRIHKSILNFIASQNLLSDPDSKWSLDPERGLTLKNTTIGDTGQYQCVGTMNNNTDWEYFLIYVKGVTQFVQQLLESNF